MDDDGLMHLTITHKTTGGQKQFESTKYAVVVDKAFRYMSKETRKSNYLSKWFMFLKDPATSGFDVGIMRYLEMPLSKMVISGFEIRI